MPPAGNTPSAADAAGHLGKPIVTPAYLPAAVAFGPQLALEGDGAVTVTYYGSEQRAVVKITESATAAGPAPTTNRTIVTVDGVDVALLLEANLARFKDGTIARHGYAEFSAQGISIIVEYFAPTTDTPEQMGAELIAIASSMLSPR